MLCRNCQTEIDDKALICFRCGAATSDPVHTPATTRSASRSTTVPVILGVLLLGATGFFGYQTLGGTPPPPIVWGLLVAAFVLLGIRVRLT